MVRRSGRAGDLQLGARRRRNLHSTFVVDAHDSAELARAQAAVKDAFDPKGLMNPGKKQ